MQQQLGIQANTFKFMFSYFLLRVWLSGMEPVILFNRSLSILSFPKHHAAKLPETQRRRSHPARYPTWNAKLPATPEAEQETKSLWRVGSREKATYFCAKKTLVKVGLSAATARAAAKTGWCFRVSLIISSSPRTTYGSRNGSAGPALCHVCGCWHGATAAPRCGFLTLSPPMRRTP